MLRPLGYVKRRLNFSPVVTHSVKFFITTFLQKGIIDRYLNSTASPRLHLGCGPRTFPDWLNSDFFRPASEFLRSNPRILPIDIRKRLPFDEGSFDFVYTEHVHEHVTYAEGLELCGEILRILKPGGVLRMSTPNVDLLLDLFDRPLTPEEAPVFETGCDFLGITAGRAPKSPLSLLNAVVGEKLHRYCYNYETLAEHLRTAGFSSVERVQPGESSHESLRNLETNLYGRRPDPRLLKFAVWHSLCVEAGK